MHSNNDGMPNDWKPSPTDAFEEFMNAKKIAYMQNNSGTFNTVHVTEWAHDYVRKLEVELTAEKAKSKKLVEAANRVLDQRWTIDSLEQKTSLFNLLTEIRNYSTDSGDGIG